MFLIIVAIGQANDGCFRTETNQVVLSGSMGPMTLRRGKRGKVPPLIKEPARLSLMNFYGRESASVNGLKLSGKEWP